MRTDFLSLFFFVKVSIYGGLCLWRNENSCDIISTCDSLMYTGCFKIGGIMVKEVFWHLPGITVNFYINQIILNMMKDRPELFNEGYKIGSVYGTFPGAIWNGGRAVIGITHKGDMERIVKTYNSFGVPVKFTWTNSLIEEKHIYDTYCNLIMEVANNGMNQVLCNRPVLEEYLRKQYPDYAFISSTTKRLTDIEGIRAELTKDYELVVLDYDLNHDEEVLKALEPEAGRIEILVDEICFPNCKKRVDHYRDEALMQLTYTSGTCYDCPNKTKRPSFKEAMLRPQFISAEELKSYIDRGYVNFKLVGRGLPLDLLVDSYVYYLAKEEHRETVRKILVTTYEKITGRKI